MKSWMHGWEGRFLRGGDGESLLNCFEQLVWEGTSIPLILYFIRLGPVQPQEQTLATGSYTTDSMRLLRPMAMLRTVRIYYRVE